MDKILVTKIFTKYEPIPKWVKKYFFFLFFVTYFFTFFFQKKVREVLSTSMDCDFCCFFFFSSEKTERKRKMKNAKCKQWLTLTPSKQTGKHNEQRIHKPARTILFFPKTYIRFCQAFFPALSAWFSLCWCTRGCVAISFGLFSFFFKMAFASQRSLFVSLGLSQRQTVTGAVLSLFLFRYILYMLTIFVNRDLYFTSKKKFFLTQQQHGYGYTQYCSHAPRYIHRGCRNCFKSHFFFQEIQERGVSEVRC